MYVGKVNAEFNNFFPVRIQTGQTIINVQTIGFFKPSAEHHYVEKKKLVNMKHEKLNQTNITFFFFFKKTNS